MAIIRLQNFSSSQSEILSHETSASSACQPQHPHPDACFCGSHDPRDLLFGSPPTFVSLCLVYFTRLSALNPPIPST